MATVTGLTAARMKQIEDASVVDGEVVSGNLVLSKHDGTQINAGNVMGPQGPVGPPGEGIPGEIKLWPGATLPDLATYGHWTWANGDIFNVVDHPIAAANISPAWKTMGGALADPGAGKFRVPDLRGLVPAGLDAMPIGSARTNRVTRADAIAIGDPTGEERHLSIVTEMPQHAHAFTGSPLNPHGHTAGFTGNALPGHAHATNAEWKAAYAANSSSIVITNIDHKSGATAGNAFAAATTSVGAGTPSGSVSVASVSAGTPAGTIGNTPAQAAVSHENMQPTVFVPYIVKLDD